MWAGGSASAHPRPPSTICQCASSRSRPRATGFFFLTISPSPCLTFCTFAPLPFSWFHHLSEAAGTHSTLFFLSSLFYRSSVPCTLCQEHGLILPIERASFSLLYTFVSPAASLSRATSSQVFDPRRLDVCDSRSLALLTRYTDHFLYTARSPDAL